MRETSMIDWKRIAELREDLGEDDVHALAQMFFEEADQVIDRLRQGGAGGTLEADMHFLAGSALSIGFVRLGTLCADYERLAAEGNSVMIDTGAVIRCYDQSVVEFRAAVADIAA